MPARHLNNLLKYQTPKNIDIWVLKKFFKIRKNNILSILLFIFRSINYTQEPQLLSQISDLIYGRYLRKHYYKKMKTCVRKFENNLKTNS